MRDAIELAQDKLRLSVQGIKAQYRYLRDDQERLEARQNYADGEARATRFLVQVILTSLMAFFATLILLGAVA